MFNIGDEVAYGILGRCLITGIETKQIGNNAQAFYSVKTLRPPAVVKTATKPQPSILVPVATASACGLRKLMTAEDAPLIFKMLADSEYYFSIQENWTAKQRHIEEAIRKEGPQGITKAIGHLYILTKQDAVAPTEISRFFETLMRTFLNELSSALSKTVKETEILVLRALKQKLRANH